MAKTIVVTGGTGYIGSHVARAFKQDNPENRVIIIDRVYREHTVKGIDGYFIADFASDEGLATIIDCAPDVLVHCAGTSLVGPSMIDPAEYYDNNVVKTKRMLDVVSELDFPPVVLFSSSASVYGEPERLPVQESDRLNPISPYGKTKLTVEYMLADYARAYGVPSVRFRYFNAAGADPFNYDLGQEPGATHIVARALEAAINKSTFTLNGTNFPTRDGTCVRDYIHVWDLALAHVVAAKYMDKAEHSEVFNLGTAHGTSNREIIDYVKEHYDLAITVPAPPRPGDPAELIASSERFQFNTTWRPQYSDIGTIIDSAYRWYTRK